MRTKLAWIFFLVTTVAAGSLRIYEQLCWTDNSGSFSGDGWVLAIGYGAVAACFVATLCLVASAPAGEQNKVFIPQVNALAGMAVVYLMIVSLYDGITQLHTGYQYDPPALWPIAQGLSLLLWVVPGGLLGAESFCGRRYFHRHIIAGVLLPAASGVALARQIAHMPLIGATETQWLEVGRLAFLFLFWVFYLLLHGTGRAAVQKLTIICAMGAVLCSTMILLPEYVCGLTGKGTVLIVAGRSMLGMELVQGLLAAVLLYTMRRFLGTAAKRQEVSGTEAMEALPQEEETDSPFALLGGKKKPYYFDELMTKREPQKSEELPEEELPKLVSGSFSEEALEHASDEWFSFFQPEEKGTDRKATIKIEPLREDNIGLVQEPVVVEDVPEMDTTGAVEQISSLSDTRMELHAYTAPVKGRESAIDESRPLGAFARIEMPSSIQEPPTAEVPGVVSGELWQSYPVEQVEPEGVEKTGGLRDNAGEEEKLFAALADLEDEDG